MTDHHAANIPAIMLSKLGTIFAERHCWSLEEARLQARSGSDRTWTTSLISDPISSYGSPDRILGGRIAFHEKLGHWKLNARSTWYQYQDLGNNSFASILTFNHNIPETTIARICSARFSITEIIGPSVREPMFFLRNDVIVRKALNKIARDPISGLEVAAVEFLVSF